MQPSELVNTTPLNSSRKKLPQKACKVKDFFFFFPLHNSQEVGSLGLSDTTEHIPETA